MPAETQTLDPTCPTCGHPSSDHCRLDHEICDPPSPSVEQCLCHLTPLAIYRHALATVTEDRAFYRRRELEALDAHARSFAALAAISQLTSLDGEVDDYADVVRAVDALREENARLKALNPDGVPIAPLKKCDTARHAEGERTHG